MDNTTNNHATTVIGMGAMGSAIAGALLERGHSVTVWNRTPTRLDPMVARGAVAAADVESAVTASELVLLTLLDRAAVEQVLEAAGPSVAGRTIVNLVTGTPVDARSVEAAVIARGGVYLDGVMMAVSAQIGTPSATILYGGSETAYDRHRSTLEVFAGDSPFIGPDAGLPALYDVALLTMLYTTMTGWLQAFAIVGSAGVRATDFVPHASSWFDNVVVADDPTAIAASIDQQSYPDTVSSSLGLNAAALKLLSEVQQSVGIDSGVVDAISALADRAVAAGHSADSYTSMIEAIRDPSDQATTSPGVTA